ncbi:MAG TPA: phage holin [Oscillospiraceae bacterium]|nr:phage holin [Oscillospiraceae bacterium]
MKINWKERLKNKTFVLSLAGLIIAFVYQVLSLCFDFIPKVSEAEAIGLVGLFINILALLGVVVDPTTEGINDSTRALTYGRENDIRKKENENG